MRVGAGGSGEKAKKRPAPSESSTDSIPEKQRKTNPDELAVLYRVKGAKPGDAGFKAINPLQIDLSLRNQLGSSGGFTTKIMYNGVLKVTCTNKKQYDIAMKMGKVVTKVETLNTTPSEIGGSKGVVYGMFAGLSEKEILDNIGGGEAISAKRLGNREGARGDPPVLLTFKDTQLPSRVFLGSMSYQVREYVRPPLRCYKCQRYGHVADSCRGNQKCAKCGGEHSIKECRAEAPKCPNCGGDHGAAYRWCEYTIKARTVQAVKERENVSYAEAVKRVTREGGEERGGNATQRSKLDEPNRWPPDMLVVTKESFLAFVVEVLKEAKAVFGKERPPGSGVGSDLVQKVVGIAEKFLGFQRDPGEVHQLILEVNTKRAQSHRESRRECSAQDTVGENVSNSDVDDDLDS